MSKGWNKTEEEVRETIIDGIRRALISRKKKGRYLINRIYLDLKDDGVYCELFLYDEKKWIRFKVDVPEILDPKNGKKFYGRIQRTDAAAFMYYFNGKNGTSVEQVLRWFCDYQRFIELS